MSREADAGELAELFRLHAGSLLRLAVLLAPDRATAEDVVQDAFAALGARWDRLREPAARAAYLRVSVVNGSRSRHRRAATARRHRGLLEPDVSDGADERVLLAEEHRAVADAVNRLPRRQRQVIALRYWADLSDAEISTALGLAPVTVRATASRALDRLQQELEQQ